MPKAIATMIAEASSLIPDNSTRQVSAEDVRVRFLDIYPWLQALSDMLAQGGWKPSARVLGDTNVNIASAPSVIDGVTLGVGDRILLTAQTNTTQNGLWVYAGAGQPLVRPDDFATGSNADGVGVFIAEGTYEDEAWRQTTTGIVDTVNQTWAREPTGSADIVLGTAGPSSTPGSWSVVTPGSWHFVVSNDANSSAELLGIIDNAGAKHAIAGGRLVDLGTGGGGIGSDPENPNQTELLVYMASQGIAIPLPGDLILYQTPGSTLKQYDALRLLDGTVTFREKTFPTATGSGTPTVRLRQDANLGDPYLGTHVWAQPFYNGVEALLTEGFGLVINRTLDIGDNIEQDGYVTGFIVGGSPEKRYPIRQPMAFGESRHENYPLLADQRIVLSGTNSLNPAWADLADELNSLYGTPHRIPMPGDHIWVHNDNLLRTILVQVTQAPPTSSRTSKLDYVEVLHKRMIDFLFILLTDPGYGFGFTRQDIIDATDTPETGSGTFPSTGVGESMPSHGIPIQNDPLKMLPIAVNYDSTQPAGSRVTVIDGSDVNSAKDFNAFITSVPDADFVRIELISKLTGPHTRYSTIGLDATVPALVQGAVYWADSTGDPVLTPPSAAVMVRMFQVDKDNGRKLHMMPESLFVSSAGGGEDIDSTLAIGNETDIDLEWTSGGPILRSPNGNRWRLGVTNLGAATYTPL